MANFTRKLTLGLFALAFLAASALAQTAPEQDQRFITLPTDRVILAADTQSDATSPYYGAEPGTSSAMPIDSSIFYEDFRDGLSGWTVTRVAPYDTVAPWVYTRNDSLHQFGDLGRASFRPLRSPTYRNGFAYFRYTQIVSDSNRRATNPNPPYPRLSGSLASPYFSTKDQAGKSLALFWYQFARTLNIVEHTVQFQVKGSDAGAAIPVNRIRDASRYVDVNQYLAIPPAFVGQDSVRVIFNYDGDYYGWAIDDIYVALLPRNDVSLNSSFVAVPNYFTPQSQVGGQNIFFVTDIQNLGGDAQAPKVVVEIRRRLTASTSERYYIDSLQYPTIAPDGVLDNNVFEKFVGMPTQPGTYDLRYQVLVRGAAEPDASPVNNSVTRTFIVSARDSIVSYSRAPVLRNATRPSATFGPGNYEVGNIYRTPKIGTKGIRIDSVRYAINLQGFSDTPDTAFYEIRTYGYKGDLNNDGIPDIGTETPATTDELVLLGTRFFKARGGTADGYYTFTIQPGEDEQTFAPKSVLLPPGEGYLGYAVGMSYVQTEVQGTTPDFLWIGVDNQYAPGANNLVQDSLVRRGVRQRQSQEYTDYVNFRSADTPEARYSSLGSNALFLNSFITVLDSVRLTSVRPSALVGEFTLSPNPASTEVNMSFDFGTTSEVTFVIFNGIGQQVMHLNQPAQAKGRITIPVERLNEGVYFVTATAADGASATRRVLIQR